MKARALLLVPAVVVAAAATASASPYRWPLADDDRTVTAYYDHGSVTDWACGDHTYSGHRGTDIGVPRQTPVFAAGGGTVKHRADGYGDGYLGNTDGGGFGNAVALFHGDGDETIYGHLYAGSGIPALGATLGCSVQLGGSGTSGNSTGPHLHFELYDNGTLIDPYFGECNQLPGGSWWIQQRNYYDSGINRLATGTKAPTWGSCPNPDTPNEATQFQPGDRVTFLAYYRDLVAGKPTAFRIIQPDGSLFTQWSHAIAQPHYTTSYWWWAYDLPADAPAGAWQFEADFNGTTSRHTFHVGPAVTPTPTPIAPTWKGFVPIIVKSDE